MSKLIFDVGMHQGRDTEFYLKKGFRVVAVEANSALVERAKTRFADALASGQLVIVNKAVVDSDVEKVEFYVNDKKDDWGTVLPDWNRSLNSNYRSVTVDAVRFENLIREFGVPYFLKIDIEGADVCCLKGCLQANARPDYVSVELMTPNNLAGKSVDALEILCYLRAMGYSTFRISDQSRLERVQCPQPPREGSYVDAKFDGHCSGLFGRELDGQIYSIDQVSELYLNWFYKRTRKSWLPFFNTAPADTPFHSKGWFDIHASMA